MSGQKVQRWRDLPTLWHSLKCTHWCLGIEIQINRTIRSLTISVSIVCTEVIAQWLLCVLKESKSASDLISPRDLHREQPANKAPHQPPAAKNENRQLHWSSARLIMDYSQPASPPGRAKFSYSLPLVLLQQVLDMQSLQCGVCHPSSCIRSLGIVRRWLATDPWLLTGIVAWMSGGINQAKYLLTRDIVCLSVWSWCVPFAALIHLSTNDPRPVNGSRGPPWHSLGVGV